MIWLVVVLLAVLIVLTAFIAIRLVQIDRGLKKFARRLGDELARSPWSGLPRPRA